MCREIPPGAGEGVWRWCREGMRGSADSRGRGSAWCPHLGTAAAVGLGGRVSTNEGDAGVFGANTARFVRTIESSAAALALGSPWISRLRWLLLFVGPNPPKPGPFCGLGVQD